MAAPKRFKDAASWRAWLAKNHATSGPVWLLITKKGARGGLRYADAVEEALCYGWIDSTVRARDASTFAQLYSPRKPGSVWAANNRARVAKLTKAGRMRAPGLAKVRAAKADGSWASLAALESLRVPPDLRKALAARRGSRAAFDAMSPSTRRMLLYGVRTAKAPETRRRRIRAIVADAARRASRKGPAPGKA